MSLVEIELLIEEMGIVPTLLSDADMKQITWGNQWIGYDDADTFALKTSFANNLCFGGTMYWSVDFNSGAGSGLNPPVTTDGSCGIQNGGTVCGNGFGSCCSASGYCGDSMDYCGSGCQSGSCAVSSSSRIVLLRFTGNFLNALVSALSRLLFPTANFYL